MQIQVNVGDAARSPEVTKHVETEVERRLGRFEGITRVEVHLRDVNGTRNGVDQRCSVEVRLAGFDPLVVDADAAELADAVREAAAKAQRAVQRAVEKRDRR